MMDSTPPTAAALHDFLHDAQVLLGGAQECVQHLEMIGNDADACLCLEETLDTLAHRSAGLELNEVARFTRNLHRLVAPGCSQGQLACVALPALGACLTLLAWQLELLDPRTGSLGMDTDEQHQLLDELATLLGQPAAQTFAPNASPTST